MRGRLQHLAGLARAIGPMGAARVLAGRALGRDGAVRVRAGTREVAVRPGDSDAHALAQVFGMGDYAIPEARRRRLRRIAKEWRAEGTVPLIVDGGANVGYASLFLADLIPEADVVAVEPGEATYEALLANVAAEPRVTPIRAALWSHEEGVALDGGDAGSWSAHVSDGGATPSYRLDSVVAGVPNARLLILKLDVEGAEAEVLRDAAPLLGDVPCIMVEPHDFMGEGRASLAPLYAAVAGRALDTLLVGETLMLFDGRA